MADIELVIKIDEENYENIKETGFNNNDQRNRIVEAIANGVPLPKGHGNLIDADALLEKQYRIGDSATLSTRDVVNVEDVEDAPTIIEADKEQKDNGFFDEIMNDESEDEETYEKIKEIIAKVKEQET